MKQRRSRHTGLRLAAIMAAAVIVTTVLAGRRLRPLVREYAANCARAAVTDAMSAAVTASVPDESVSGMALTRVQRDADGSVLSVETDTAAVNVLCSAITAEMNRQVAEQCADLKISLWSAVGSTFLMGKGPQLTLRICRSGAATAQISSTFAEAGINQTVHRMEALLTFRAVLLVAGMSEPIEVSSSYLIAETVIVGTVPDTFATIVRESAG